MKKALGRSGVHIFNLEILVDKADEILSRSHSNLERWTFDAKSTGLLNYSQRRRSDSDEVLLLSTVLVTFNGSKQGVSIKTGNCTIEAKRMLCMNIEIPNIGTRGRIHKESIT